MTPPTSPLPRARHAARRALVAALVTASVLFTTVGPAAAALSPPTIDHAAATDNTTVAATPESTKADEAVRVLVRLDAPQRPDGTVATASTEAQREAIDAAQRTVEAAVPAGQVRHRYDTLGALAMTVPPEGLAALEASPEVGAVVHDDLWTPALTSTVGHLDGEGLHADRGLTGEGQAVAIVDSGVERDHPAFGDRVIEEACFATGALGSGGCPDGTTAQVGQGAAAPLVVDGEAYGHGTHVAGVAAGAATDAPELGAGLAPDADIVAVQVFHEHPIGPVARTSDVLAGLDYLAQRASEGLPLAAANVSVGGGAYSSVDACERGFDAYEEFRAVADHLASNDVAVVAAAGNDGHGDALAAPACVEGIVSVGATSSPDREQITSYSNVAEFLDLVAPGTAVTSAAPGHDAAAGNGTSTAAPMVTGAFAALQGAPTRPHAPDVVVEALRATAVPVLHPATGAEYPEVRPEAAADLIGADDDEEPDEGAPPPPQPDPDAGVEVARVAGEDRYDTAARLSAATFDSGVDEVYLATAGDFADALAGAVAAARAGAPLLLVSDRELPAATAAELARLDPAGVVVLGGEGAVAPTVEDAVAAHTGAVVERIAGENRYATAAAISQREFAAAETVYVATGGDFADGLAGAPAAAADDAPLLLTADDRLPAATEAELKRLAPDEIVVLGGEGAVGAEVEAQLEAHAPVERIAGEQRFATAALVADRLDDPHEVFLATGFEFADALAAAAVAGARGDAVLLTAPDRVPDDTLTALEGAAVATLTIMGGGNAVASGVESTLEETLVE